MPTSDSTRSSPRGSGRAVIDVHDLHKAFRMPRNQISTLKERLLHPLTRTEFDDLRVLRGLDFQIAEGEFFGIVGRNGSGKSTLLKCLAGIYAHDRGTIKVAGRLAPFIELGVGFNPDLTARENVLINAVMMGMPIRQAREQFEEIIAFAELEDFLDLKLKNYSSGMQVRLAFSTMIQADADVLLIDEVLAVGDAAFQQKCLDVFYRLRDEGKTIVLVTHDMGTVERFCHRAMLIKNGVTELIGDPQEVGHAYLEENFARRRELEPSGAKGPIGSITHTWIENQDGVVADAFVHGSRVHLHAVVQAYETIDQPRLTLWIENAEGVRVIVVTTEGHAGFATPMAPGELVRARVDLELPLADGHYYLGCSFSRGPAGTEPIALTERTAELIMFGGERVYGVVSAEHQIAVERTGERAPL